MAAVLNVFLSDSDTTGKAVHKGFDHPDQLIQACTLPLDIRYRLKISMPALFEYQRFEPPKRLDKQPILLIQHRKFEPSNPRQPIGLIAQTRCLVEPGFEDGLDVVSRSAWGARSTRPPVKIFQPMVKIPHLFERRTNAFSFSKIHEVGGKNPVS